MERVLKVSVNGEAVIAPAGASVLGLLQRLGLDPRKLAVERNLEVVPRSQYGEVGVEEGDRFEIVQFVGGG